MVLLEDAGAHALAGVVVCCRAHDGRETLDCGHGELGAVMAHGFGPLWVPPRLFPIAYMSCDAFLRPALVSAGVCWVEDSPALTLRLQPSASWVRLKPKPSMPSVPVRPPFPYLDVLRTALTRARVLNGHDELHLVEGHIPGALQGLQHLEDFAAVLLSSLQT